MDARQLEQLAKSLVTAGSWRGLLRLAAMLPAVNSFLPGWSDETDATGRHQRRKKRHKHEKGQHKDQRKGKGKHGKKKHRCTASGQTPTPDTPCCQGLVVNAVGVCADRPCDGECAGCCDASGVCLAGGSDTTCGTGGVTCQACSGGQVCHSGTCQCVADVCASGCPFATVQAAIDAATPGSTITICPGRYVGTVDITKNLTLTGAGQGNDRAVDTILDADGSGRTVRVGPGRVVSLSGLRITGGWLRRGAVDADLGGGGLLNRGTLTMTNCTVDSNVSTFDLAPTGGGGISNGPSRTMTMTNCTISGNSLLVSGAAGAGVSNIGTVNLNGCAIVNNTSSNNGGGVAGDVNSHTTLTGCTVSGNSASNDGGGLFSASDADMTIINCQITNNEAPRDFGGGAFVDLNSSIDVQGSTVSGNTARAGGGICGLNGSTIALRAGTAITGNHASLNGGGVFNQGTITACTGTVSGNTAGNPPVASNCVDSAPGTGCTCPA